MALIGGDGLTWQERRAARRRAAAIRALFFDTCLVHGEQPIDPYDETLMICGCARPERPEDNMGPLTVRSTVPDPSLPVAKTK